MKCEKAGHLSDKDQYKEVSFWEKIKLVSHILFCKFCREYVKNNKRLSEVFKESDLKTMTRSDKLKIKKRLYEEILK